MKNCILSYEWDNNIIENCTNKYSHLQIAYIFLAGILSEEKVDLGEAIEPAWVLSEFLG